ncbi:MAG: excalibur calcium-binding domain-containing protein [Neisseria sp.]|nr:excalibur calcium-binding domain-containing protein [Neisseria sp.]
MKKLLLLTFLSASAPLFAKTTCSSFNTQAEAQRYYLTHNAYWLDRDRDGEACECLPGGSKYGKRTCKKYRRLNTPTPTFYPTQPRYISPPITSQPTIRQVNKRHEVIRVNPLDADPTPYTNETLREATFRHLPQGKAVYSLNDVQIRSCPSKNCSSYGVIPKSTTMYLGKDNQNFYYHKGWIFVHYQGSFCFLENHTHKTGCLRWSNPIRASGWVYSGNLAF